MIVKFWKFVHLRNGSSVTVLAQLEILLSWLELAPAKAWRFWLGLASPGAWRPPYGGSSCIYTSSALVF